VLLTTLGGAGHEVKLDADVLCGLDGLEEVLNSGLEVLLAVDASLELAGNTFVIIEKRSRSSERVTRTVAVKIDKSGCFGILNQRGVVQGARELKELTNSLRSGNPFGRPAALLNDYEEFVKGVPRKFKAGVDRQKHLEAAIQDLFETIEATENIRIKFHLLSRATECGEKHYETARKNNPTATSDLDDKFYETGCMRWIIQQAYLGFSDSKSAANAYWTLLEKAGFSKSHLLTQHRNLYNAKGELVNGDDNLTQKGWLTPVWIDFAPSKGNTKKDAENQATPIQFEAIDKVTVGNVCRKARPNGGSVDVTKPGLEKYKGEARVFRYKPTVIDKSKLTKPLLAQTGLSKMDPHEEAFLKGFNPKFDDKTDSFWGYGGAVWVLNGALESGANADGQRFMQARKEQLLTTSAGPSGTTDEMLQMFDYCGLTGNPVTSDPLKEVTAYKAAHGTPSWHLANGVLGAFANMGVYYHHSYLEVLEGAGCDYNGKNSVDRAFDYDFKNPYDWMLSLGKNRPAKVSLCSMAYDKTKKDAPKFTIGDSQLGGTGFSFTAIQTVYKALSDPKSSQHQALLATDFPNYDSKDKKFYPGKGPHQWARNSSVQALTEKDANLVCNNNNVPKEGTWHFLFCGAQKESMSLLSAAVSKSMTFDQLDAAFSDLI